MDEKIYGEDIKLFISFILLVFFFIWAFVYDSNVQEKEELKENNTNIDKIVKDNRLTQECAWFFVNNKIISKENKNLHCKNKYLDFLTLDKYKNFRNQRYKKLHPINTSSLEEKELDKIKEINALLEKTKNSTGAIEKE